MVSFCADGVPHNEQWYIASSNKQNAFPPLAVQSVEGKPGLLSQGSLCCLPLHSAAHLAGSARDFKPPLTTDPTMAHAATRSCPNLS